ncbi:hypothetical protein fh0823_00650 [Francisella halioticida]|uniref:Uncharacterized protein n=1 Tax=Francisella halioticida TaxID=549298 RepID=A0ABN5B132_9GAMM|nr:hypothetical protein [Francisella halioticida]ASG67465.1 hypothetical protein CDV26_02785 [Francisella halioticida]BCD89926.1 hypothetical protein fh0823_00650 [Francisella halioticida]
MLENTQRDYLTEINKNNYKKILFLQEINTPIGIIIAIADNEYLYTCCHLKDSKLQSIEKILKIYSAKVTFKKIKL